MHPGSEAADEAAPRAGAEPAALRLLQSELRRHLLGEPSGILDAIVDAPPLPPAERLAVYRNAYQVRLIEALDDIHPILHRLLGDEVFSALGESFVASRPSVHRSIRWYGAELAEFLAGNSPYDEQPVLSEIARLEWTLAEVFDAADAEPLERAAIAAVRAEDWGRLRFTLHPSVRRLQLKWNAVPVWQAISREETPPEPLCADVPAAWVLWRRDFKNYFRSMTPADAAALDAARSGACFAEICSILSGWLDADEIPPAAANQVAVWADSGMIVSLD